MWIYKMELLRGEEELKEETPQPIITIQLGEERLVTQAFIDSKAYRNTISYELYKQLKGVELHKTTTMFKLFTGHKTKPRGVFIVQDFVDDLSCRVKLFLKHPSGITRCINYSWKVMEKEAQLLLQLRKKS